MPTVPVVDQSAGGAPPFTSSTWNAPGITPMRNSVPEQQEAMGQAMQRAGETAMQTGATIGDRLAEQVDDAKTKQAETGFLQQTDKILNDPQTGFLNQRGENAIDQFAAAKQAVVKASQDALGTMSNPIQKQMLTQVLNQHLLSVGKMMSEHNFQQTTQYSGEAAVSRANTYATTASNAYTSYGQTDADGNATGDFAKNLQVAEQETLNGVRIMKGAPAGSDVANAALLNLHTQVGMGALEQMLDARAPYSKVQAMYDDMKAKGWLTAQATDTLGRMVKAYTGQEVVRATVNQQLSDAVRTSQKQPTTSMGTPDYQFPIKGATATAQTYDPEQRAVRVSVPQGTSIQAPADGSVTQVGKDADGDFTMQIEHVDGSVTTFAGLNASNVKVGDHVERGEDVATSGQQGSSSPSVLWSLADKNGNAVDPTKAGLPPVDTSKITDETVLGHALEGIRKQITDPYLQQQAVTEAEMIVRRNQQMANAAATQVFKQASDAFYSGGMNWRAIPPSTFNQLTPAQQQEFKDKQTEEVLKNYGQGQAFKEMNEVDLRSYFLQNPDMLTPANVDAARPKLANATYLQLMNRATELQKSPQSVVEAQNVNERIKYFAGHAGLNVGLGENKMAPADKQQLSDLTFRVQQDIDQIKAQNHGKATPDQVDKAIQQELIQRTATTLRSPWDLRRIFGSPNSTITLPRGATQTARGSDGKMHYLDRNNQDLGVVP